MTDPSALICLEDVTLRYGKNTAVHDVSGSFTAGSLTAIAGPNGAGKSTLLKAIAGILPVAKGRIVIAPEAKGRIAYLPQSAALARDFPITLRQAMMTGFWPEIGSAARITQAMQKRIEKALEDVGLTGMADRGIEGLSGGQFQRLMFARVMLTDACVILLDEPFAAVDAETTAKLMQILLDWHAKGRTIICVLHDLLMIRKYFPESFLLAGHCLGRGHTHALFEQKLLSFDLDMAEIKTPAASTDTAGHDHA